MAEFAVFLNGAELDLLQGLDTASRRRAAVQTINRIARDARAQAAREIRKQVNFPVRFLADKQGRFYIAKKAQGNSLEARIRATGRVTSLAQFVSGGAKPGKAGVYVEVAPGRARFMKRAFTIRLPQGNSPVTDTKFNLGLAIRLRPGETLNNKVSARKVSKGLYVLYGPSVSQVFLANDGTGVAEDISPSIADKMEAEFLRLLELR